MGIGRVGRLRRPPPPRRRYPSPVRAIRAPSSILRTIVGPIRIRCASGPCPPPRAFAMYGVHPSLGLLRFAPSACRLVASSYDRTTVRRRFPAVIMLGETSPRLCGRVVAAFPIMSVPCCRTTTGSPPDRKDSPSEGGAVADGGLQYAWYAGRSWGVRLSSAGCSRTCTWAANRAVAVVAASAEAACHSSVARAVESWSTAPGS